LSNLPAMGVSARTMSALLAANGITMAVPAN